jgi:hypothetical protein
MDTTVSKNESAKGSARAFACTGKTPSSTPASLTRVRFSDGLNHKSVAQTSTPNSRRRNTDERAQPHPRSSTRIPARRSMASASHSVIQSGFAAPLTPARSHSGWYRDARGNRPVSNRSSRLMRSSPGGSDDRPSHTQFANQCFAPTAATTSVATPEKGCAIQMASPSGMSTRMCSSASARSAATTVSRGAPSAEATSFRVGGRVVSRNAV